MKKILIVLVAFSIVGCLKNETEIKVEPIDAPVFTYNAKVYGQVTGCHDLLVIELLDSADTFPYPLDSIISDSPDNRVFAYDLPDSLQVPGLLITVELEEADGPFVYWGPGCWGTPFLYNFVRLLEAAPIPE
ncbi:MAG: hypothetical protein GQ574_24320 [Crocinitomix sp.]|nr:hypothetical protein [Crocinitomix sp.]